MIISFFPDGALRSLVGYRIDYTNEMIDALQPIDGYGNYRIYDAETIDKVWTALDTGGIVKVELDDEGIVLGVITENGELEPPTDEPIETGPTPIELLQQENELLRAQNKAISERADFIEDIIAEMAMQVYQ